MTMRLGLTTTPERNAALTADAVALGFEPVSLPCIRIVPSPAAVEGLADALAGAHALVVTSARTVAMISAAGPPRVPIIAVGPATAQAVADAGGTVAWVGSSGIAALASEAGHLLADAKIVIAGATNTARESAAVLEGIGGSVEAIGLYTTLPTPPGNDDVAAVVFGSPTAVEGWLTSRDLSGLLIGAIGPTTAAALRGCGTEPDVVPHRPGFMNTIEQLAALRPERSTP